MQSERITARIRCDIIWHLREEGARTGRSMSKQLEQILLDRYSDRILDDTEYVIENAATAAYELDADLDDYDPLDDIEPRPEWVKGED